MECLLCKKYRPFHGSHADVKLQVNIGVINKTY